MSEKRLISVLNGEARTVPPIWLMRQAGRYLPEYRALRAKAGSFWTMCMSPGMATEITLQPIRRFGFDAAIIFSDILTVPHALGQTVTFTEGEGPSLPPIATVDGLERDPSVWRARLAPAYETLQRVRGALSSETALLGFAGAPWTLATYMAAGKGGDAQMAAKIWAARDAQGFQALLDLLGDCVAAHLVAQLDAGADAVQIFDSWAEGLAADQFESWVTQPTARLVGKVRTARPEAKIIGFPRGMSAERAERFHAATRVDAISVATQVPLAAMRNAVGIRVALQGNLDPLVLVEGGAALERAAQRILDEMHGQRFIFNLGHGVVPETPIAHVERLLKIVRGTA
ncbi:MAG TPA: uroporphyrinogen decarboxylase [Rhizomicrobium sp.]|nr:uroporphyrinogen decarboxylase [Rhizomicrobium sp.]